MLNARLNVDFLVLIVQALYFGIPNYLIIILAIITAVNELCVRGLTTYYAKRSLLMTHDDN